MNTTFFSQKHRGFFAWHFHWKCSLQKNWSALISGSRHMSIDVLPPAVTAGALSSPFPSLCTAAGENVWPLGALNRCLRTEGKGGLWLALVVKVHRSTLLCREKCLPHYTKSRVRLVYVFWILEVGAFCAGIAWAMLSQAAYPPAGPEPVRSWCVWWLLCKGLHCAPVCQVNVRMNTFGDFVSSVKQKVVKVVHGGLHFCYRWVKWKAQGFGFCWVVLVCSSVRLVDLEKQPSLHTLSMYIGWSQYCKSYSP